MQSRFYAFMLSIVNFFSRAYSTSSLKRILVGSGDIERYAQDSAFYRGIKKILNPVISFFTGICRAASEGTQSSIAAKIYGIFFSRSLYANAIYFISFVCVFIFVIPHNFWSNMFGLVFAAALIVLYIISASNPNKRLRLEQMRTEYGFRSSFSHSVCLSAVLSATTEPTRCVCCCFL